MLLSNIAIALGLVLATSGPLPPAESVGDEPCGLCKNGWGILTFINVHKFRPPSLSSLENAAGFPIDWSQVSPRKMGRAEASDDANGVRIGIPRSTRPGSAPSSWNRTSEEEVSEGEVEWESTDIAVCSIDLGCHSYLYKYWCLEMHWDCLEEEAAAFIDKFSAKSPTSRDLANALQRAKQSVHVNFARSSVQVSNCKGAIIANIPVGFATLASAVLLAAVDVAH